MRFGFKKLIRLINRLIRLDSLTKLIESKFEDINLFIYFRIHLITRSKLIEYDPFIENIFISRLIKILIYP